MAALIGSGALLSCERRETPVAASAATASATTSPSASGAPSSGEVASCDSVVLDEHHCLEYRDAASLEQALAFCKKIRGQFARGKACAEAGRSGACLLPEG